MVVMSSTLSIQQYSGQLQLSWEGNTAQTAAYGDIRITLLTKGVSKRKNLTSTQIFPL
jgi:hypothetical protein